MVTRCIEMGSEGGGSRERKRMKLNLECEAEEAFVLGQEGQRPNISALSPLRQNPGSESRLIGGDGIYALLRL